MRAAQISLIISTYERPEPLDQVLRGVERQSEMPAEIIIADDGSGPATCAVISQWQQHLAVPLRHLWQPHAGFRKTLILNQSVAAAKSDYVVLLDGDCVPHRKFIADHAALAEKNFWVQGRRCFVEQPFVMTFSAAAAPVRRYNKFLITIGRASPASSATARPVGRWMLSGRITGLAKAVRLPFPVVFRNTGQRGIIGCNMGFWREDLLAINGFDEEYTGWGIGEDSDLGTRLYHLGRPRKFVYGRAIVYHLNHPMLGRSHLDASRQRLAETIRSGKIRCERGIDQYLPMNQAASRRPSPPQGCGGTGEGARGGPGGLKTPA